jgi:hypothetical protein
VPRTGCLFVAVQTFSSVAGTLVEGVAYLPPFHRHRMPRLAAGPEANFVVYQTRSPFNSLPNRHQAVPRRPGRDGPSPRPIPPNVARPPRSRTIKQGVVVVYLLTRRKAPSLHFIRHSTPLSKKRYANLQQVFFALRASASFVTRLCGRVRWSSVDAPICGSAGNGIRDRYRL